ncbi:MAG: HXXEE domain-containing protein [Acidobacteriota bacterium]
MSTARSTPRWVFLSLFFGVLLLLLAPVFAHRMEWSAFILLVYLQTPLYMLHQVEEHTGDRFRAFVNRQIYGGLDALTPAAVLVANIPGVWGITALSLNLAVSAAAGWGLLGVYLMAVNAIVHVVALIRWRRYNPGLWTALLLFLPVSVLSLWKSASTLDPWRHHLIGLGTALAIHGALVLYTSRRAAHLRHDQSVPRSRKT